MGPRLDVVPGPPLVHDEADLLIRVIPVHNRGVFAHQFLHDQRLLQAVEPFPLAEPRGRAGQLPVAHVGVIVQRQARHDGGQRVPFLQLSNLPHQDLGPVIVGGRRPTGDLV